MRARSENNNENNRDAIFDLDELKILKKYSGDIDIEEYETVVKDEKEAFNEEINLENESDKI